MGVFVEFVYPSREIKSGAERGVAGSRDEREDRLLEVGSVHLDGRNGGG